MSFIEAKLNRSQSRSNTLSLKKSQSRSRTRKPTLPRQRQGAEFPGEWCGHSVGYDSLKYHLRDYKRKKLFEGKNDDTDTWEHSFSLRLNTETTKINGFYEERYNECIEGLRRVETELTSTSSLKSVESIRAWHEFTNHYSMGVTSLELGQDTPFEFVSFLESQLVKMAGRSVDQGLLNTLKKLVLIHKLALQLKKYALFNQTEFKKLLKRHDKITRISISTEWMYKLQQEKFIVSDSFEKTVAITKAFIRCLAPKADDFSCAICLGLLRKPVSIRCGHRFCKDCLTEVAASYNFCPMCRMEQDLHSDNYIPEKQLKSYLKQYFPEEYKVKKEEHTTAGKKKDCIIM